MRIYFLRTLSRKRERGAKALAQSRPSLPRIPQFTRHSREGGNPVWRQKQEHVSRTGQERDFCTEMPEERKGLSGFPPSLE